MGRSSSTPIVTGDNEIEHDRARRHNVALGSMGATRRVATDAVA
jgi:hypothetical protein